MRAFCWRMPPTSRSISEAKPMLSARSLRRSFPKHALIHAPACEVARKRPQKSARLLPGLRRASVVCLRYFASLRAAARVMSQPTRGPSRRATKIVNLFLRRERGASGRRRPRGAAGRVRGAFNWGGALKRYPIRYPDFKILANCSSKYFRSLQLIRLRKRYTSVDCAAAQAARSRPVQ